MQKCTKLMLIIAIVSSFCFGFTGSGKGTESDPYQITTIEELQQIENDLNGIYIIRNDIDASKTKNWNEGKGFNPIGDGNTPFTGRIDGKGYTIKGLYTNYCTNEENKPLGIYTNDYERGYYSDSEGWVKPEYSKEQLQKGYEYEGMLYSKRPEIDNIGFISLNKGTVKSLKLIDASVTGNDLVGGITGENYGTIEECTFKGTIDCHVLGGIVCGNNSGRLHMVNAEGSIQGKKCVGGITGRNQQVIVRCGVEGKVKGTVTIGGFAGENRGSIAGSYSESDISGDDNYIGGFVGYNLGLISGCYAKGNVSTGGTGSVSGFSGQSAQDQDRQISSIYSSYFIGSISSNSDMGAFVKNYGMTGLLENCYTIASLSEKDRKSNKSFSYIHKQLLGIGGVEYEGQYVQPSLNMIAERIEDKTLYESAGWDFETEWGMQNDLNDGYPYLLERRFRGKGSGIQTDPYQITTLYELQQMNKEPSACYVLKNDIDASATRTSDWKSTGGFSPVMNFSGVLDGRGFRIFNLFINRPYISHAGFIGFMKGGEIKNLGLVNADVTGSEFVGIAVAENESGKIQNVYAAGKTAGGGIAGRNLGMICNCFAFVDGLSAGFVQVNRGSLVDNYFIGKLQKEIKTPYSSDNYWQSIENAIVKGNFYDKDIAGDSLQNDTTCCTAQQMKKKELYENAGWDFKSVWSIDEKVNNGYPFLKNVKIADVILKMDLFEKKADKKFSGKGSGSKSDPYCITSLNQLQETAYLPNACYVLLADIDALETKDWNYGKGFDAIGSTGKPFNGSFQGNSHLIKNLNINTSSSSAGIFSITGENAEITDVKLVNIMVRGTSEVGALAGENRGRITGCSVQGQVKGELWNVGGLTGKNSGLISNADVNVLVTGRKTAGGITGYNERGTIIGCAVQGKISANGKTGGIAGDNFDGIIKESFNRATVSGNELTGGITGWNRFAEINQTYSASEINCTENCGGIAGRNQESTILSSFYCKNVKGNNVSSFGTSLTSEQMKSSDCFSNNGWDFESVWELNSQRNDGFPYLKRNVSKLVDLSGNIETIDNSVIKSVKTSSIFQGKTDYEAFKACDDDYTTAWVEGADGAGKGEWIEIEFITPQNVKEIIIVNGYVKTAAIYSSNNRISVLDMRVETEHGIKERTLLLKDASYSGTEKRRGEVFGGYKGLRKVRFSIRAVYKGKKYDDTCISEIFFVK